MSDLLLMASSPLRSLLSTPGLVACYLPWLQVAQGATGQTLLDYSGRGNHATLGSTAGVDANDPAWGTGGKWLEFDGVDDYTQRVPSAVLQEFTRITILKPDNVGNNLATGQKTIWSQFGGFPEIRSCGIRFYNSTRLTFCSSSAERGDVYVDIFNVPEMLTTQPQIIGCTYKSGSGQVYVNGSFVSYSGASPTLRDIPDVPFVLMSDPSTFGINGGNIYAHLDINRQCSDAEIIRLHHTLKTLLAGQGVTLE